MPHDKKGRLVEVGDHVKFKSWADGAERLSVGRVFSVSPGSETCNVSVVHLNPGYWPISQACVTAKETEVVLKADGSEPGEGLDPQAQAGFGKLGAVVATLLLALACLGLPVFAADEPCGTPEKPQACISATAGVVTVATRGERREYADMGAALEAPLPKGLAAFANVDLFGVQDGGSIASTPQSFRSVKAEAGVGKRAGAFRFNVRGGATFSVEGQVGAPIDPRMFDAQAEAELLLEGGGHLGLHGGHNGTVGGWALGTDVDIPVSGGPAIVAHFDFPLHALPGRPRAVVLTAGGRVKVKSFRLRLPK